MASTPQGPAPGGGARSVIHDLRQPLAALQVWVDLLDGALKGRLEDKEQRYLGKIRDELARLTALLAGAAGTDAPASVAGERAATTGPPGLRLAGLPVLVVEDDDVTAEALQLALEGEGASVAVASSIEDALELLEASRPVAVLTDLKLADGDGYALAREVRARDESRGTRTAVVAVTGFDGEETRRATSAAGFDDLVGKPFSIADLVAKLERLTAMRR
jgi:CheY-like chemotaxis protein